MKKKTVSPLASLSGTVSLGGELTIRRLGFGAMRITGEGSWGPPKDPASALAVLRRAVELGVNFIDTADSYGPYVSEELIAKADVNRYGNVVRERKMTNDQQLLASKFHHRDSRKIKLPDTRIFSPHRTETM
jgi:aryl-alcohol dehydrogenase-like predicted oxidoreductase